MGEYFVAHVHLDAGSYRSFAVFDGMLRTRRWLRPAAFALFFVALACIAFLAAPQAQPSMLLGIVLLLVGTGLPLAFFWRFHQDTVKRIRAFRLDKGRSRYAYTLALNAQQGTLEVQSKGKDPVSYRLDSLHGVWIRRSAVYLYASAAKAYILPKSALVEHWEDVLRLLGASVPPPLLHR